MNDYQTGKNMINSGILQQQAQAFGGQCLNNAPAAPQRRMEGCLKRFEHLMECYADLATHAEQLASSIAGPSLQPDSKAGCATPQPSSLIGQLEGIADQFEGRRERIQAALKRLQEL